MEIGKFRTDPKKELQGVEIPVGDNCFLTVARSGNDNANAVYERLTKDPQHRLQMRTGNVDPKLAEDVVVQVMGEAILLNWRGMKENGIEVPYSRAKALEFLRIKDFRNLVTRLSETQEWFRAEMVESSVKN